VPYQTPHGFEMRENGLYRDPGEGKTPFRVCGPFEVLGETRPENGDAWGLLLRWKDRDGREHEWIMPRRLLAGEAAEVRQRFADCGLDVSGTDGSRRALVQFLADVKHSARVRTVGQTGWYRPATGGAAFVLPGSAVGHLPGEIVRLDIDPPPSVYRTRSPLQEWRDRVASLCAGNSRAVFAIGCGFAAPLLPLLSDEGGGFNFRGESSKGKTTLIDAAATVWGAPSTTDSNAFVRQWRSTGNALEATAAAHNHVLLPMDELGQADPRELAETLYMLANGAGKGRAKAGGGNRAVTTWNTLVLSSSEESAARMIEGAGRRMKAGQEVRLIDIPAIVPGAYGCFEDLHGLADGKAFAQAVRRAAVECYGSAGPDFVRCLSELRAQNPDAIAEKLAPRVRAWCAAQVPAGADGQVQRAGQRFAVVAVAGELAGEFGITGWPAGDVADAVGVVFRAWLRDRGSTGSREDQHLFAAFRKFMMLHGNARFEPVRENHDDVGSQTEAVLPDGSRVMNRAGWRWQDVTEAGERVWIYGMQPDVFDAEIAAPLGMEGKEARGRLGKAGMIRGVKESGELRWTFRPRSIPGHKRPRLVFRFTPFCQQNRGRR
jgi:putative DNA primase/helicase